MHENIISIDEEKTLPIYLRNKYVTNIDTFITKKVNKLCF